MRKTRSSDDEWSGATYAQRQRALDLGLTIPKKATRKSVAALIRAELAKAEPSEEQLDLAQYFRVAVTPGMTSGELDQQLVPIVREHALTVMRMNPALRAGTVLYYGGLYREISFIGGIEGRYVVRLKPLGTTGDRNLLEVLIKDIVDVELIAREVAMAMLQRRRRPALTH